MIEYYVEQEFNGRPTQPVFGQSKESCQGYIDHLIKSVLAHGGTVTKKGLFKKRFIIRDPGAILDFYVLSLHRHTGQGPFGYKAWAAKKPRK